MKKSALVSVRRAPKYGAFAAVGALVGVIIAGVLAFLPLNMGDLSQEYSRGAVVGMGVVLLAITGAVLGAGVALVMDAVLRRKARTVEVTGHYEEQGGEEADSAEASPAEAEAADKAGGSSLELSPEEQKTKTEAEQAREDGEA
ncbi:hypothetical protein Bravens_01868 [Brevibacterium ravenspurgense]|uniref:Uncharacterized protein n=1 Tax=Brevibacterium ravenspurgense TaxID=479117 RepID=A0A150H661_9MICO|nr:hypothetical protein [Brevibacterium ravenspurgense]KXZ57348.1 hypothetical protein Bravens_01868 [Brevibacterium ravenspurgense]